MLLVFEAGLGLSVTVGAVETNSTTSLIRFSVIVSNLFSPRNLVFRFVVRKPAMLIDVILIDLAKNSRTLMTRNGDDYMIVMAAPKKNGSFALHISFKLECTTLTPILAEDLQTTENIFAFLQVKHRLPQRREIARAGIYPLHDLLRVIGAAASKAGLKLPGRWPLPATDPLFKRWIVEREGSPSAIRSNGPMISFLVLTKSRSNDDLRSTFRNLKGLGDSGWEMVVPRWHDMRQCSPARAVVTVALESAKSESVIAGLLAAAQGEFIVILDAGDLVAPVALDEFSRSLQANPDLDLAYSDEDKLDARGARSDPFLKPEWSPEYLETFNYFGRLTFIRRSLAQEIGALSGDAGEAAEWDLNLRVAARARKIRRIPQILCHRALIANGDRSLPDGSAASDQRRVITNYWARNGITATVTTMTNGTRSVWPLADEPLVSVIIMDSQATAAPAQVDELLARTDYEKLEVFIVEGPSSFADPSTPPHAHQARHGVRYVPCSAPENRAFSGNVAAHAASGALLLFLSADLEVTSPQWIEELVRRVLRPEVAVVAPLVLRQDGLVHQAGGFIGLNELSGPAFQGASPSDWGPFGSADLMRNVLHATGSCFMVRRDVFEQVGGFDENFAGIECDVALSLAVWQRGYRAVVAPQAMLSKRSAEEPMRRIGADQTLIARCFDDAGLSDDPYFHPGLDAGLTVPTLRVDPVRSSAENIRTIRVCAEPSRAGNVAFDIFNGASVVAVIQPDQLGAVFWPPQAASEIREPWGAMRFVVDCLRRSADLRARFPNALSAGADGAFAQWLTVGEGRVRFRLSTMAIAAIQACFAMDAAEPVRRAFQIDKNTWASMPLGACPPGLGQLFGWLVEHGRFTYELRIEAIWWFALECSEQPAVELVRTFLFNREWQTAFPDGLTMFSRDRFARWLKARYNVFGSWMEPDRWPDLLTPAEQIRLAYKNRTAWQRRHPEAFVSQAKAAELLHWLLNDDMAARPDARAWLATLDLARIARDLVVMGANVLGHFCFPSGLKTSICALSRSLQQADCAVSLRDVWVAPTVSDASRRPFSGLPIFDTTIIHVQPEPDLDEAFERGGWATRQAGSYRIGYWYWELETVPTQWLGQATKVDELWAATRFVADGMRQQFRKPVYNMLPGLELPAFKPFARSHFGIPADTFAFLFIFNFMSVVERKNPLGLIRAFKDAFGEHPGVLLVLKTTFGSGHGKKLDELQRLAGENVRVIDSVYTRDETLSLMQSCDCYVSLHRSEGLGLTMAEAMLLGRPVVATGYSGNIDFMDSHNSLLVDYKLAELIEDYGPYPAGARWAEPSLTHAASCMRKVYDNRDWAQALGHRARMDLRQRLSHATTGSRMAARLAEIDSLMTKRRLVGARDAPIECSGLL